MMKPHEVTPENLHLAVALIIERQATFFELHKKHGQSLEEIKVQVTKTNGRVNAHDAEIAELRLNASATEDKARIRKLEDAALIAAGKTEGMTLAGKALWAVVGTAVSGAVLWLMKSAQ